MHQSLTIDIGDPHLEKQLISVITLMNISDSWKEFLKNFGRKFKNELIEISQSNVNISSKAPKTSADQYLMFDEKTQVDLFGERSVVGVNSEKEPLSDFNTKLQTALNYNPKKEG